jgi:hypothetical protein
MAKLTVVIGDENYRLLSLEAASRGISIQELIRAVIVPECSAIVKFQRLDQRVALYRCLSWGSIHRFP